VDVVPIKFLKFVAAVAMEMAKMLKNWKKTQKWS
jgi:hypothetical protein